MFRGLAWLLVLLAASSLGCSSQEEPHAQSIPEIPPGRAKVGPEQGEQVPVAPPAR